MSALEQISIAWTIAQFERDFPNLLQKIVRAAGKGSAIHPTPEEWETLKRHDWLRKPSVRHDRTVRSEFLEGVSFLRDEVVELVNLLVTIKDDGIFLQLLLIDEGDPLRSKIEQALKSAGAHERGKLIFYSEGEKFGR